MESYCEDGFCVIGAKAARVLPPVSPQVVTLEQVEDARRALDALNRDLFSPVVEPTPQLNAVSSTDYEQNQDSKQGDQWKNPKTTGKSGPKRQGHTSQAINSEEV